MKLLVIVDAQNDFITGSLANPEAQAAIPRMVKRIGELSQDTLVLFTKDTHYDNYLETEEGKNLPVKHCIYMTEGWSIHDAVSAAVKKGNFASWNTSEIINSRILKETFGSVKLAELIRSLDGVEEVLFMGFCTDICVVSNVLLVKAYCPELKITVDASCCAGVTPQKHKAALETMKSCQIQVIGEEVSE